MPITWRTRGVAADRARRIFAMRGLPLRRDANHHPGLLLDESRRRTQICSHPAPLMDHATLTTRTASSRFPHVILIITTNAGRATFGPHMGFFECREPRHRFHRADFSPDFATASRHRHFLALGPRSRVVGQAPCRVGHSCRPQDHDRLRGGAIWPPPSYRSPFGARPMASPVREDDQEPLSDSLFAK